MKVGYEVNILCRAPPFCMIVPCRIYQKSKHYKVTKIYPVNIIYKKRWSRLWILFLAKHIKILCRRLPVS